jgi:DNA-binding NarL/FixJ family response regulator
LSGEDGMNNNLIDVLLIEDNPGDVELMKAVLQEIPDHHFQLITSSNLSDGIEQLRRKKIEIILLDLFLLDSHGIDSFQQLHAQFPETPIVILTGLDDKNLALQAVKEGAQDFVVKGDIRGDSIDRIIRYAIERNRLLVELEEKSDEKYQKLFHSSPYALGLSSLENGTILDINDANVKMFGYSRAESIGKNSRDMEFWPDYSERDRLPQKLIELGYLDSSINYNPVALDT